MAAVAGARVTVANDAVISPVAGSYVIGGRVGDAKRKSW